MAGLETHVTRHAGRGMEPDREPLPRLAPEGLDARGLGGAHGLPEAGGARPDQGGDPEPGALQPDIPMPELLHPLILEARPAAGASPS